MGRKVDPLIFFRVEASCVRISGLRVEGLGFRVHVLGLRVEGWDLSSLLSTHGCFSLWGLCPRKPSLIYSGPTTCNKASSYRSIFLSLSVCLFSLSLSLSLCFPSEETINVDQTLPLDHPYNLAVTENFDGFVDAMPLDVVWEWEEKISPLP